MGGFFIEIKVNFMCYNVVLLDLVSIFVETN